MLPQIDGQTQVLGILGENSSTLSPAIHNFSARYLNLNYVYVPLPQAELATTITFLVESNIAGVNITYPYKQEVARLLASDLPSINTLYRHQGKLCGTSTDGQGFWQGLAHSNIDHQAIKEVIILGNGGVGLALLDYLCQHQHLNIYVLARNRQRDEQLQKLVAGRCQLTLLPFTATSLERIIRATPCYRLVVQATNAPAAGDDLQRFCPALDQLTGAVVDLSYHRQSALYRYALQRGITAQDGLPMLIEQARLAQQLWWGGRSAPYQEIVKGIDNDDQRGYPQR